MEKRTILAVEEIHTYYGQSHILQGVTLSLEEGAIVAVLGRNGVGKTTLMRSLIGFNIPQEGRIYFRGEEITRFEALQEGRCWVSSGSSRTPDLWLTDGGGELAILGKNERKKAGLGSKWNL